MKKGAILFLFMSILNLTYAQLSDSLIAYYTFNDTTAMDASGNNNNGIKYNVTPTDDRFGNANHALSFNGTNSYVWMPDGLLVNDSMSISLWFKTNTNNGNGCMIGHQNSVVNGSASNYVPIAYVKTDSLLKVTFWGNGTGGMYNDSDVVADGSWHHLVVAGDQSEQRAYLDNNLIATGNAINNLTGMIYNQIGTGRTVGWPGGNSGWFYFHGDIDDVRIYHRKLDSTDVDSLYNLPDPNAPMVITTTLNEQICIGDSFLFAGEQLTTAGTYTDSLTSASMLDSVVTLNLTVKDCNTPTDGIFEYESQFSIYPNPAKNYVEVQSEVEISSLKLLSVNGQVLVSTDKNIIDLNNQTKGLYILEIKTKNATFYKKLIKE